MTLKFGDISVDEIRKRNKCFIGCHETLIAASADGYKTDPFFKYSITYYGSGQRGNAALNVYTKHQQSFDPSDNTTGQEVYKYSDKHGKIIKEFFNEQIFKILKDDPGALFMTWSQEHWILFAEEFHKSVICANSPELVDLFGNKKNFKEFVRGKLPQADFEVLKGNEILYRVKQGVYPYEREVVAQSPQGILGVGTMFFKASMGKERLANSAAQIDPSEIYVVSEYIDNIGSPSVCAMVSNSEAVIYPPWMMAIQKDSGSTAGSDLAAFTALPESAQREIKAAALKAAKVLQENGYRGTANIDMMATDGKKHPKALITEINARDPETICLLTVAASRAGRRTPHELKVEAHYAEKTSFANQVILPPNGRKFYGPYTRAENGQISVPQEYRHFNLEGLDCTVTEDNIEGTTRQGYSYTGFIF